MSIARSSKTSSLSMNYSCSLFELPEHLRFSIQKSQVYAAILRKGQIRDRESCLLLQQTIQGEYFQYAGCTNSKKLTQVSLAVTVSRTTSILVACIRHQRNIKSVNDTCHIP